MPTIKETYGLPERTPVPMRLWLVPGIITVVAVGGWLALPHTPAVAGLLVVAVLVAVGSGIGRIMTSRQLSEPPQRKPVKPPSVGGD